MQCVGATRRIVGGMNSDKCRTHRPMQRTSAFPWGMMSCVIFNSAAPAATGPTRRGATAQEEKRSPTRTTARNPNVRSFTVTIPAVARGKRLKGCTARIVPNYSAFRKRDRKRESQHHVSDCETLRSQLRCRLRLARYTRVDSGIDIGNQFVVEMYYDHSA